MSMATHAHDAQLAKLEGPRPEEIAEHLRHLLASSPFHGSKRCQQFLEYVCEKSLAGEVGALKERCLAIDLFGRQPELAGHGEDTIVRVSAREVRKRLAQYYATPEGNAADIRILLPPGSYAPEFHYSASAPLRNPAGVEIEPVAIPQPSHPEALRALHPLASRPRFIAVAIGVAIVIAGAAAFARWHSTDRRTADFQRFWAPVFASTEPLLIGVGNPIVYQPSRRAALLNAQRLPPPPFPMLRPLILSPSELNGSDIVPVFNQFVGFGDMVAANEVSQMLAHRSRNVRLMLASGIPFADLRQSETYLIGAVSNRWTMELGQGWRFRFGWTPEWRPEFIDTLPGSNRAWTIPSHDDGSIFEDYSMICRIHSSPTGRLLLVSAGIKQFGTEAGGRIIADPMALGTILNKLPPGWEEKNLQLLLHVKVIGDTPAQPEVVAWQVW